METGIVQIRGTDDLVRAGAHAKVHRIYAYWKSIHPSSGLPGRQNIDPLDIGDVLPGIWLLDIEREPLRLRYRLVGTRVVEVMGRDATGLWLDEAHPGVATDPGYLARIQKIIETGIPSWRRGAPYLWRNEVYEDIENLMMPLARDGQTVDMLMILSIFYRQDGTAW